jgi:hypothetical protein
MKPNARWGLSILLPALLIAQPALAFEYPLSSEAIREAYFLGRGDSGKMRDFFEKYKHHLPVPKTGADVALIEMETPFACVVDGISRGPLDYHSQDAEQEYLGKPGEFRVHVEIYFTPTYPKPSDTGATRGDFWRDFSVHLKQKAEVPLRSVHGQPIYSDDTISGFIGAMIDTDYDVTKIDAGGFTTIEVDTPDGQQVETTFQINSLR